jgi:hypothetical protein
MVHSMESSVSVRRILLKVGVRVILTDAIEVMDNIIPIGTVSGSTDSIPTVLDSLFSQKTIGPKILGMSLPPFSSQAPGSIDFGGEDSSKHTGALTYTPITKKDPAKDYWGIDQSVQYGGSTILEMGSGIIDSGSTMILLTSSLSALARRYSCIDS